MPEEKGLPQSAATLAAEKPAESIPQKTLSVEAGELMVRYLPLVDSIVRSMMTQFPPHADAEELRSVGLGGLISAVLRYNPEQAATFTGYLAVRIRGAILDELRRLDWMPRTARAKFRQLQKTVDTLEQNLGRAPSEAELCHSLEISAKALAKLQQTTQTLRFISLNAGPNTEEDNDLSLEETIADEAQPPCHQHVEKKELSGALYEKLQHLSERQKQILCLHYYEGQRLAEIATTMGVSEARICQIHVQSLAKLRGILESHT